MNENETPNENSPNPFAISSPVQASAMSQVAGTRAAQEVQAAMVIAKKFPRNESQAYERIMTACKRKKLAEDATYEYSRGGTAITGPSIRLAEVAAQAWGNLESGIVELEQRNGESDVLAFCWDLETNTRSTKTFLVKHERHTKAAGVRKLTDPRDIYELIANQGARRLRSCILATIPGDVIEDAVAMCNKTLTSGNSEPMQDRIRKMLSAFSEFQVTVAMIEKRLQHKLDVISEQNFAKLRRIYTSLKDGMSTRDDWFDANSDQPTAKLGDEIPGLEPKSPVIDLRAEFKTAVTGAGLTEVEALEWLRTQHPEHAAQPTLDAILKQVHGKTLKVYIRDLPFKKAPVSPKDYLGDYSPSAVQLVELCEQNQIQVGSFLKFSTDQGLIQDGISDVREMPNEAVKIAIQNWASLVPQIKLASQ